MKNSQTGVGARCIAPLRHMTHFLLFICLLILAMPLAAQTNTGVWVTTQDYSSLRVGPGKNFARIAVIDPAVTLPAIGRSPRTNWVQVEYNGQRGWFAAKLLV